MERSRGPERKAKEWSGQDKGERSESVSESVRVCVKTKERKSESESERAM